MQRSILVLSTLIASFALVSCASDFSAKRVVELVPVDENPRYWEISSSLTGIVSGDPPTLEMPVGHDQWIEAPGTPRLCGNEGIWAVENQEPTMTSLHSEYSESFFLTAGSYRLLLFWNSQDDDAERWLGVETVYFFLEGLSNEQTAALENLLLEPGVKNECPVQWSYGFGAYLEKANPRALEKSLIGWLESSSLSQKEKWWLLRMRREVALDVWLSAKPKDKRLLESVDPLLAKDGHSVFAPSLALHWFMAISTHGYHDVALPESVTANAPPPTKGCQPLRDKLQPFLDAELVYRAL